MLSKNVNNKKCAPKIVFFYEKNEHNLDDFWHRKLTLKVKFWQSLTPPHYTNSQNSMISFDTDDFYPTRLKRVQDCSNTSMTQNISETQNTFKTQNTS